MIPATVIPCWDWCSSLSAGLPAPTLVPSASSNDRLNRFRKTQITSSHTLRYRRGSTWLRRKTYFLTSARKGLPGPCPPRQPDQAPLSSETLGLRPRATVFDRSSNSPYALPLRCCGVDTPSPEDQLPPLFAGQVYPHPRRPSRSLCQGRLPSSPRGAAAPCHRPTPEAWT